MTVNDEKGPNDDTISHDAAKQHMTSISALAFAMFCQTYLLISVFPYSGFLAIYLIPGLTTETAGSYAGLISASFMFGRALSSYAWGTFADTVGRKPVLYWSFLFSGITSLWFGLATSIESALTARFLMGLLNGLILVCKTSATELGRGNEKLEARGMGIVLGMWGYGYLVGPVISGVFSEPVKQYPDSTIVMRFEPLLSKYPFLLPNLVSVFMCAIGSLAVYLYVDETLPEEKRRTFGYFLDRTFQKIKSKLQIGEGSKDELLPLRKSEQPNENYGNNSEKSLDSLSGTAMDDSSEDDDMLLKHSESCAMLSTSLRFDSKQAISLKNEFENMSRPLPKLERKISTSIEMSSIWGIESTRNHLISYWLFSFSNILVDEGFPLFCIAASGGLNLTELGIGKILSGAGFIYIISQYFVFASLMSRFGLYKTMLVGTCISTPVTILIPLSLYLNRGAKEPNDLSYPAFIFLCFISGMKNVGGNVAVSALTIATNRTVPSNHRATMNGLSMLGGSFMKAIGPACAGFLASFLIGGGVFRPVVGSIVLYVFISFTGLGCVFINSMLYKKYYHIETDPSSGK